MLLRRRSPAAAGSDPSNGPEQPKARRTLAVTAEPARWSACYAPHASMYFDQFGKVRACCQNTGVYLGDVKQQSLRQIWESAEAEQMRTALEGRDFSAGCEFCEWQLREGNEEILFAREFDHWQPEERRPTWPRQMEFSLTNTCNLQCAMCNGDWSSTIRAKREGRPPLAPAYDDAFYEQLAEFLPHLRLARFLGGEPFLGKEPLRVMEMLAALDEPPEVNITTNGTIATERVRRIIETLRPTIVVSIDGASPSTYDAIRIGAHFPEVLANLDRFIGDVGSGSVSIAHCLMTSNWHEFADLLALAEERSIGIGVNVVRFPEEQSLYQLEADELGPIVEQLHATEVELTGSRREIWDGHLAALARRLAVVSSAEDLGPKHGLAGAPLGGPAPGPAGSDDGQGSPNRPPSSWLPFEPVADPALALGNEPVLAPLVEFDVGHDGTITNLRGDGHRPWDVLAVLDGGCQVSDLTAALVPVYGPIEGWTQVERPSAANGERYRLQPGGAGGAAPFAIVGRPRRDLDGKLVSGDFWLEPTGPEVA